MHRAGVRTATVTGYTEIVNILLDKGADVNTQGWGSRGNALEAASRNGHTEIVKILLDQGADMNAMDEIYENALEAASLNGHHY